MEYRGVALVKRFEGVQLSAYQDSGGVWTIGYGHTKGVREGDKIGEGFAERLLRDDLADAEEAVLRVVKVPLTQSMFDALTSWTFNLGAGNLGASTMLRRLNAGLYLEVPGEMMRWYRTPGSELGLLRRRVAEAGLFLEDGLPT